MQTISNKANKPWKPDNDKNLLEPYRIFYLILYQGITYNTKKICNMNSFYNNHCGPKTILAERSVLKQT